MPRRCSVFGCRTNYDSQDQHHTTFSLPKNEDLRKEWLRKIPTDFSKIKNPVVCIKHFEESSIIYVDKVMVKGELKEFPRERLKLIDNAVPTIFPNAPSYLTISTPKVTRLPDVEQKQLEAAIEESIFTHQQHLQSQEIKHINDVKLFFKKENLEERKWVEREKDNKLFLCFVDIGEIGPVIEKFIVISNKLEFEVFLNKIKLTRSELPIKEKK